jgi:DNA-binding FadR family transcriptional regulator
LTNIGRRFTVADRYFWPTLAELSDNTTLGLAARDYAVWDRVIKTLEAQQEQTQSTLDKFKTYRYNAMRQVKAIRERDNDRHT